MLWASASLIQECIQFLKDFINRSRRQFANEFRISPGFMTHGAAGVGFEVQIVWRYAGQQVFKRPTALAALGNQLDHDSPIYQRNFYHRIAFQLRVVRKGCGDSQGKTVAPFLNFGEHAPVSFLYLQ
jgi:hypothetical protein